MKAESCVTHCNIIIIYVFFVNLCLLISFRSTEKTYKSRLLHRAVSSVLCVQSDVFTLEVHKSIWYVRLTFLDNLFLYLEFLYKSTKAEYKQYIVNEFWNIEIIRVDVLWDDLKRSDLPWTDPCVQGRLHEFKGGGGGRGEIAVNKN